MFARGCEGVNLQLMGALDERFFIGAGVKFGIHNMTDLSQGYHLG